MKYNSMILLLSFIYGCGPISVTEYKNEKPELKLEEYFIGKLEAVGIVRDRSGKVIKRFVCAMNGTLEGSEIVLDEDFTWSDNTKQKRVWRLTRKDKNILEGTAGDVAGRAKGEVSGNALHLTYSLDVPMDGATTRLDVDDWLYLVTPSVMINHSQLTKFGFNAAQVILTIRKL